MNTETIKNKVVEIVTDYLGIDASEVKLDSHLNDDLGADSLDSVEILMALEEEFDIEIDEVDLSDDYTVGNVVKVVAGLKD